MDNFKGDPVELALSTLGDFIASRIKELTVIKEWPYGNQKLEYPSLTITLIGSPKRMPEMPYQVSQEGPDENNKLCVKEVVANWDFKMQLDIWCSNKLERKQYTEKLISIFNTDQDTDGLSIKCCEMYDEWIRYEIDNIMPVDDEAASERQERREKIEIIVNFREVRQRSYYAIVSTQLHSDVSPVDQIDSTDTNTEVKTIF